MCTELNICHSANIISSLSPTSDYPANLDKGRMWSSLFNYAKGELLAFVRENAALVLKALMLMEGEELKQFSSL